MKQFFLLLLCCVSFSAFGQLADEDKYSGGAVSITGFDFPCIPVGTSQVDRIVLSNPGTDDLIVTDISVDDTLHFVLTLPTLPFTVPQRGQLIIPVRYTPTAVETNTATVHLQTAQANYAAVVAGCGEVQGSVRAQPAGNMEALLNKLTSGEQFAWLTPTPNPSAPETPCHFVFGLSSPALIVLEIFDMNGREMFSTSPAVYHSGQQEISVDAHTLIAGTYIYRYSVDGNHYSGLLTIM